MTIKGGGYIVKNMKLVRAVKSFKVLCDSVSIIKHKVYAIDVDSLYLDTEGDATINLYTDAGALIGRVWLRGFMMF